MVDSPRKEKQKPFLQTRIYIFSTIKAHIIYNSFTLTWKLSIKTDYIFSSHDGYKISLRQKEQSSPTSEKLLPDVVKKHDSRHRNENLLPELRKNFASRKGTSNRNFNSQHWGNFVSWRLWRNFASRHRKNKYC